MLMFLDAIKSIRQINLSTDDICTYEPTVCGCCMQRVERAGLGLKAAKLIIEKLRHDGACIPHYHDEPEQADEITSLRLAKSQMESEIHRLNIRILADEKEINTLKRIISDQDEFNSMKQD
jgi:hypothetical protein